MGILSTKNQILGGSGSSQPQQSESNNTATPPQPAAPQQSSTAQPAQPAQASGGAATQQVPAPQQQNNAPQPEPAAPQQQQPAQVATQPESVEEAPKGNDSSQQTEQPEEPEQPPQPEEDSQQENVDADSNSEETGEQTGESPGDDDEQQSEEPGDPKKDVDWTKRELTPEELKAFGWDEALEKARREGRDLTYEDISKMLKESAEQYKPQTPEQKAKEEKRRKRTKLFAAIGDGLSSLANLYFTTKGAPNVEQKKENMLTEKNKERWEKLDQQKKDDNDRYLYYLQKQKALADDKGRDDAAAMERKLKALMAAKASDREDHKAKVEYDLAKAKADTEKKKGGVYVSEAAKNDALGKKAEAEAKYKKALQDALGKKTEAEIMLLNAKTAKEKAEAAAAVKKADAEITKAKAAMTNAGANVTKARKMKDQNIPYGTFDGKKYYSQADYEAAVAQAARDTRTNYTYGYGSNKRGKGGSVVKRSVGQVAGIVQSKKKEAAADKKKRNPYHGLKI